MKRLLITGGLLLATYCNAAQWDNEYFRYTGTTDITLHHHYNNFHVDRQPDINNDLGINQSAVWYNMTTGVYIAHGSWESTCNNGYKIRIDTSREDNNRRYFAYFHNMGLCDGGDLHIPAPTGGVTYFSVKKNKLTNSFNVEPQTAHVTASKNGVWTSPLFTLHGVNIGDVEITVTGGDVTLISGDDRYRLRPGEPLRIIGPTHKVGYDTKSRLKLTFTGKVPMPGATMYNVSLTTSYR